MNLPYWNVPLSEALSSAGKPAAAVVLVVMVVIIIGHLYAIFRK